MPSSKFQRYSNLQVKGRRVRTRLLNKRKTGKSHMVSRRHATTRLMVILPFMFPLVHQLAGASLDQSRTEGTVSVSISPVHEVQRTIIEEDSGDEDNGEGDVNGYCHFQLAIASSHDLHTSTTPTLGTQLHAREGHRFECRVLGSRGDLMDTPFPFVKYKLPRAVPPPLKVHSLHFIICFLHLMSRLP